MKNSPTKEDSLECLDGDGALQASSVHHSVAINRKAGTNGNAKEVLIEYFQDAYSTQEEDQFKFTTFYSKDGFRDAGYSRSGKYYLPDPPNSTELARKSDLLLGLISKAFCISLWCSFSKVLSGGTDAKASELYTNWFITNENQLLGQLTTANE